MKRDSRLHLDPLLQDHYRRIKEDEEKLEASVSETAWDTMLRPLVAQVLGRSGAVARFPSDGDSRFRTAFESISTGMARGEGSRRESAEHVVLERRLAERLADVVPASFASWQHMLSILDDWTSQERFMRALPIASVESCVLDIMRMPSDRRAWLDSILGLEGADDALTNDLNERRARAIDTWSWLDEVERYAEQTHVRMPLILRSQLLARVAPAAWTTWLTTMPHAFYAAVVVDSVDNLDHVEVLIASCREALAPTAERFTVQLLLVRRALELWEAVGASLSHAATMDGIQDAARAEYVALLEEWEKTELPRRLCRLVDLVTGPAAVSNDVAVEVLRQLRTDRGRRGARQAARLMFREVLLDAFATRDVPTMISSVLGGRPGGSALLVSAKLAGRAASSSGHSATTNAYSAWLRSKDFYWASPLEGDQLELVAGLGECLSSLPDPVATAKALLDGITATSQGWGFSLDAWFDAIPRTAHVLVVIAVSSEGAQRKGSAAVSQRLFDLAWNALHSWLHDGPLHFDDERIQVAIAYVWAYAGKFGVAAPRSSAALFSFDDVRRAIWAATHYAQNANPRGIPVEVQRVMRRLFDDRRELLARHPHIADDAFQRLVDQVRDLTPDASVDAN
jgi:hypothetical protein